MNLRQEQTAIVPISFLGFGSSKTRQHAQAHLREKGFVPAVLQHPDGTESSDPDFWMLKDDKGRIEGTAVILFASPTPDEQGKPKVFPSQNMFSCMKCEQSLDLGQDNGAEVCPKCKTVQAFLSIIEVFYHGKGAEEFAKELA